MLPQKLFGFTDIYSDTQGYENTSENKRYYYQLDGEGIRYEIVAFARAIEDGKQSLYISQDISEAISGIIGAFYREEDVVYI